MKSPLGGYGLYYRTTLRALGLVAGAGTELGDDLTPVDLVRPDSPEALHLADLFGTSVDDTTYVRRYADAAKSIPREVLQEYATNACLCQLDSRPNERDALKRALLFPGSGREQRDVDTRREAFAFFLQLLTNNSSAGDSDHDLRAAVWRTFEKRDRFSSEFRSVLARWSALAATHGFYRSIHMLWTSVGPLLRDADKGDGLSRDGLEKAVATLADAGQVRLPNRSFRFSASRPTADLLTAVAGDKAQLPDFVEWARENDDAARALTLMLATYTRLPKTDSVEQGWTEIGSVNGEHQPGLLHMALLISQHLNEQPSIAATLNWAVRTFVLSPHEEVAQTKFPEFTFRFRWEGGRLRFYPSPELHYEIPALGDIRSSSLSSLSEDLGFCEPGKDGRRLTQPGKAFVREVLG
ncbi:MAG TPA: hypothetical protein VFC31_08570 [Candidatus Limnocylindria bacterium]|nr:hypothetical protein [Candidatus Limnocylindria bacterium]